MMKRALFAAAAAALALGGCATAVQPKIRSSLVDAGLSYQMADCMAERMANRLSVGQLRSLGRLRGLAGRDAARMSVQEFLRRARALVDPEVYQVVTSAGLGCAIAG